MLKLLLGRDWVANRSMILDLVAKDIQARQGNRILMVPELISHDTERRLCAAGGQTTSRYAEVLTFTRLANRVADTLGHAAQECLDNGGRVVAMASAVQQVLSKLKAYAAVATQPEFYVSLLDAVDEFKRCCITPGDLVFASRQTSGSLAQKLEELSLVLEAYDGICSRGRRDPQDQMSWLLEELTGSDYASEHVFYIEGFPDFTRQHMAILEHLICASGSVTVSLNCDAPDSRQLAFEQAGKTALELLKIAQKHAIPYQIEEVREERSELSALRDRLFQGNTKEVSCSALTVFQADSLYQECNAAAERIMALVRSGDRYRDISVVCADMPQYSSMLQMVFSRCNIPAYISGTESVLDRPVMATVLSALDAALGGFDRDEVLRYMKSALSPIPNEICDSLENYCILWGIHGVQWTQPFTKNPDGLTENWTDDALTRLSSLEEAREALIKPLQQMRTEFAGSANLGQQILALYRFLEEICLAERLDKLANELDDEGDFRSAQILHQLWDILLNALEQMYDVMENSPWNPDTFPRLFRMLLDQYDVGTIPHVLDAVTVGPVNSMRCQETKHLIVLGALEGSLPAYSSAKGVLTEQDRTTLCSVGLPLAGGCAEALQGEFAEIYGVFCGARETVCVSCPGGQPSYLYQRLKELAGTEKRLSPTLGAALCDPFEAAAYLSRWNGEQEAQSLGLNESYQKVCYHKNFLRGTISFENVQKLYGKCLRLSVSQIDQHAVCKLSYFLRYGLKAKERKQVEVDPAEFGTYVHDVLENTFRQVMQLGGFRAVSVEKIIEIAAEASEKYQKTHFAAMDSARTTYLFQRNYKELEWIVRELWDELRQSEFIPAYFELRFDEGGDQPSIPIHGEKMDGFLRGVVDRADIWRNGQQQFLRIVDYKTGKKEFDYCDILNGVGLQMLLYLFALESAGDPHLGVCLPAGVQYFPARVPMIQTSGADASWEKDRADKWKRSGLLLGEDAVLYAMEPVEKPKRMHYSRNKDGEISGMLATRTQFGQLKKYVYLLLKRLVDNICQGDVEPDPYMRGSSFSACKYCPYHQVCHPANVENVRNFKTVSAERFWQDIEQEVKDNG
ncbi:MAG: exodeoxyribonuclease V subunit gamma [Oscillospiraceae bacterium]|nr:exodeoxyribonuclease V subunit gamma [Oscillospiraceae bacterium]